MTGSVQPLVALRRHTAQAPWSLGELAALADALLASVDVVPDRPTTERTVRFYVTRAVIQAPFGRGPGSAWGYPHLVELLAARLGQHRGESLDVIAERRASLTGTGLEEWTAAHLVRPIAAPAVSEQVPDAAVSAESWQRVVVDPGVELHLAGEHPLVRHPARLRAVLDRLRHDVHSSSEES